MNMLDMSMQSLPTGSRESLHYTSCVEQSDSELLTVATESPDVSAHTFAEKLASVEMEPKPPTTVAPERKRRSHQKSRKGCTTCKKRKVKCSEEKPVSLYRREFSRCALASSDANRSVRNVTSLVWIVYMRSAVELPRRCRYRYSNAP